MPDANGKRAPPAYQEYAASMLADRAFRSMSAVERGVFYSMRLECWANQNVPVDKPDMARVLGMSEDEVQQGLTARVLAHFEERQAPDGKTLICPEHEEYRIKLDTNYQNRAAAGLKNMNAINERRKAKSNNSTSNSTSNASDNSTGAKYSTEQTSQNQSTVNAGIPNAHSDFIKDYDAASAAEDEAAQYRTASGG